MMIKVQAMQARDESNYCSFEDINTEHGIIQPCKSYLSKTSLPGNAWA